MRLFLDFDGTLVPLRARPDDVKLSAGTRRALKGLVRHQRVNAVIVSGRRRGDLIRYVRLPRMQYWGLYGWERRNGCSLPRGAREMLERARGRLTSILHDLPGVRIEDKGLGFSVHVRGATRNAERQALNLLRDVLARYGPALHVMPGKKVWNVVPHQVPGKGPAVRDAVKGIRSPYLPIFVGDDLTDEPAFAALTRGITVRVGVARHTKARYRLLDPEEVRRFIERLDGELS